MPFAALLAYDDEGQRLSWELQRLVGERWPDAATLGEQKASIGEIVAVAIQLQRHLNRDSRPDTARALDLLRDELDPQGANVATATH